MRCGAMSVKQQEKQQLEKLSKAFIIGMAGNEWLARRQRSVT